VHRRDEFIDGLAGSSGSKFFHGMTERIQCTRSVLKSLRLRERFGLLMKNPAPGAIPKLAFIGV
jgi:hypothetical protein